MKKRKRATRPDAPQKKADSARKKPDPAAAKLGRRGGLARAKALTAEERRASAVKAIRARWAKAKRKPAP